MVKTFLTKMYIHAFAGEDNCVQGQKLADNGSVSLKQSNTGSDFKADVYDRGKTEHCTFSLDNTQGYIRDFSCTCDEYEKYKRICPHVTAAMLASLDDSHEKKEEQKPKRASDEALLHLIDDFTPDEEELIRPEKPLRLHICFVVNSNYDEGRAAAGLQAGTEGGSFYPIDKPSAFFGCLRRKGIYRLGDASFNLCEDVFDEADRPLVSLLQQIMKEYDDRGWLLSEGSTIPLTDTALDEVMNLLHDAEIHVTLPSHKEITASVRDQMPEIHADIVHNDSGCQITFDTFAAAEGRFFFYLLKDQTVFRIPMKNKDAVRLFRYIASGNQIAFVSERDLPAFATYLIPVLQKNTILEMPEDFHYENYLLEKPKFKIYLDQPYADTVTAELYAVYSDHEYNILKDTTQIARRDFAVEHKFLAGVKEWFNDQDPVKKRLVLSRDDDAMYLLLTSGIPSLQQKAEVFISDQLKKILHPRSIGKMHMNLNYSHDLLQLSVVSDTFTMPQLMEIMNRYDPLRSYYRLKDGEFVTLNQEEKDQLSRMQADFSALNGDVNEDSISIPKYRAMFLEDLRMQNAMDTYEEPGYINLIESMKEAEKKTYRIPEDFQGKLRPYQKKGFEWLCRLRDEGFSGLLADEMGLGKTIQVIAFLGAWSSRGRTLIVTPASLVANWMSEIEKFMPSLPARMIVGTAEERSALIHLSAKNEILITSYDLLRRDRQEYSDMYFDCEVLDEAQYIKNSSTIISRAVRSIHSSFRIALTGTPIENRLTELYSIFEFLMPGFFGNYREFRREYEGAAAHNDDEAVARLRSIISPFVLRRLKKDVLTDLPPKIEQVVYATLEGEQKELYDARLQRLKMTLQSQNDEEFQKNRIVILTELMRLRQICCDPALIYKDYTGNSAKKELCLQMIRQAADTGHKILLFSQFSSMLDLLTEALRQEQISSHLLKGSTPQKERSAMVASFATDDVPVFAISLKAGGTGLNLTAADIVIHYDPWWNTAVENQASDRTHRIGQKNIVNVYRLIMKGAVEEGILALQNEKRHVADQVLSGEGMASTSLTRQQLLQLLDQ